VILKKNPDYWRPGLPHMERVIARSFPDASVRLQSFLKGEADFLTHPDPKDVAAVQKNPDVVTHSTAGWTWDYQHFNLAENKEMPYHNKLVRQAISYAIDREALKNEIYHGQATVTDNAIPPGFLGHRKSLLKYPKNGDLKKAKELMAQAGVSGGFEVEVMTSDKDWVRKELELVAAMVSQIGIKYKIRNMDIGSFNNLWINNKKGFQQMLEDITIVAPDPHATVYWFLHSKGSVSSGYNNPAMDTALESAMATSDPAARAKLYHQVVDMTLEDCSLIYHLNANYVRMHKKNLSGFAPAPQEYIEMMDTIRWTS
jgi:peptide/nickel transport system substrate-binding protein